jgi:L-ascorbate metabolism protein UlaG (beta-lactamase superfamily)
VPLDKTELQGLDAALVSHSHFDHFDRKSLRRLGKNTPIVVPVGTRQLLRGVADVREVDVGDEVRSAT